MAPPAAFASRITGSNLLHHSTCNTAVVNSWGHTQPQPSTRSATAASLWLKLAATQQFDSHSSAVRGSSKHRSDTRPCRKQQYRVYVCILVYDMYSCTASPVHSLDQVGLPELDLYHSLRLQHATTSSRVSKRLNVCGVDLAVNHHPGSTTQLAATRDVDEHGLLVHTQLLHD